MFDDEDMMGGMEDMPMEGHEMGSSEFDALGGYQAPKGPLESMLSAYLPDAMEVSDLLGQDRPDDAYEAPQALGGFGATGMDFGATSESGFDTYSGRKPYDPEEVKRDVRAFLSQKAQERAAASDEYQKRASETSKSGGGGGY